MSASWPWNVPAMLLAALTGRAKAGIIPSTIASTSKKLSALLQFRFFILLSPLRFENSLQLPRPGIVFAEDSPAPVAELADSPGLCTA